MSSNTIDRVRFVINQIKEGEIKSIFKVIVKRIYSENLAFGFKRDLNKKSKPPRTLIKIIIRPFEDEDDNYFKMDGTNIELIKQIPNCYVAITIEGIPCFRLWLLDTSHNKKIQAFWGDTYPQLKDDEVLLESAFTIPKFRGMGLHSAVMYQIGEQHKENGANYVLTFTPLDNINSLRSTHYAGFYPYTLRKEKYLLFNKSVSYEEIPIDLMEFYKKSTNRKYKAKA